MGAAGTCCHLGSGQRCPQAEGLRRAPLLLRGHCCRQHRLAVPVPVTQGTAGSGQAGGHHLNPPGTELLCPAHVPARQGSSGIAETWSGLGLEGP